MRSALAYGAMSAMRAATAASEKGVESPQWANTACRCISNLKKWSLVESATKSASSAYCEFTNLKFNGRSESSE